MIDHLSAPTKLQSIFVNCSSAFTLPSASIMSSQPPDLERCLSLFLIDLFVRDKKGIDQVTGGLPLRSVKKHVVQVGAGCNLHHAFIRIGQTYGTSVTTIKGDWHRDWTVGQSKIESDEDREFAVAMTYNWTQVKLASRRARARVCVSLRVFDVCVCVCVCVCVL